MSNEGPTKIDRITVGQGRAAGQSVRQAELRSSGGSGRCAQCGSPLPAAANLCLSCGSPSGADVHPALVREFHEEVKRYNLAALREMAERDRRLINARALVSPKMTALHVVAKENREGRPDQYNTPASQNEIGRWLIEEGAQIEARDAFGATPLHYAAAAGTFLIAYVLRDYGADFAAVDGLGDTPLHKVVKSGKSDLIESFILNTNSNGAPVMTTILRKNAVGDRPVDILRFELSLLGNDHAKREQFQAALTNLEYWTRIAELEERTAKLLEEHEHE